MKAQWIAAVAFGFVALGVLAAGFAYVVMLRDDAPVEDVAPPVTFPVASGVSTVSTRRIDTTRGSVTVRDFTEGKSSLDLGGGERQFDLTPYPEFQEGVPYPTHAFDVQFNEMDSSFVVTLNAEPLGEAREGATAFLRQELGGAADLCDLNVIVGVPYATNPTYSAYDDLGLSGCPGALPLP